VRKSRDIIFGVFLFVMMIGCNLKLLSWCKSGLGFGFGLGCGCVAVRGKRIEAPGLTGRTEFGCMTPLGFLRVCPVATPPRLGL
jgi:hypothetical protein